MLHSLITIVKAEVAKADQSPTNGEVIAGFLTLSAIVLSCMTLVHCFRRWQRGQVVMPVAKREPLYVPVPLAILGVIVATVLASATTLSSIDDMTEQTGSAEVDSVKTDQAAEASIDGTTDAPTDAVQPTDSTATSDETASNKTADDEAKNIDRQSVRTMALRTIDGTLQMSGLLLLLFGSAVWLVQATGPGRSIQANNSMTTNSIEGLPQESDDRASEHHVPTSDFAATSPAIETVQEPWNLLIELKFAGMAFLMALVPTFAARLTILSFLEQPKSHQFITMIQSGALSIQLVVLLLLIATIVAPVVEELLYRVVVLGGIKNRRAPWVAITVSSVLFSFAHGFPDSISLLPLAFVLGYTYTQRRSYRTVMLVHLIFNSFNMVLLLIQLFLTD